MTAERGIVRVSIKKHAWIMDPTSIQKHSLHDFTKDHERFFSTEV